MKLVEDATVKYTGATTTTYGANQIVLVNDQNNIASFIDAERAPRKGYEDVTYNDSYTTLVEGEDGEEDRYVTTEVVVAYVPETVAEIANLAGKKVDVIFGKDNEVVYLEVVSDVVDNSFVTAWNAETTKADSTIEIDGEEYELAANVTVSIFGEVINENAAVATVVDTISALFGSSNLNCLNKGNLTRKVVVDFELDNRDDVKSLNFKFSHDYVNGDVEVAEYIVEDVTATKIVTATGSLTIKTLENAKPRVVKNNKVATLDDIAAGDVLTVVKVDGNTVIYAVSNAVEGTLTDYVVKSNALTIDDEDYNFATVAFYNVEGETDDYSKLTKSEVLTHFEDDEVTAYLNMFGEVVAIVGESEATGTIVGVITSDATREKDRASKVHYFDVEILAADGTKEFYSIYNKTSGKDMAASDLTSYEAGTIVIFSADEDGIIKSDKIDIVADGVDDEYLVGDDTLEVKFVTSGASANIDNKRLTAGSTYQYNDSTVIMNYVEDDSEMTELISWKAFTQKETDGDNLVSGTFVIFTRGTKLVYIVSGLEEYGVSDEQYGIITKFGYRYDEDEDRVYTVTVLTDGTEETYDCEDSSVRETYEKGDFIAYKVSADVIAISEAEGAKFVKYDLVDALDELHDDDNFTDAILAMFSTSDVLEETDFLDLIRIEAMATDSFEVEYTTPCAECGNVADSVECEDCEGTGLVEGETCEACEAGVIACEEHDAKDSKFVDLDEDVVVYDLTTSEMGELEADQYVLVIDTDAPADPDEDYIAEYDVVIIVK